MPTPLLPVPPNPADLDDAEGAQFSAYLAQHSIQPVKHRALNAYQHAPLGRFLSAENLNHCLTLDGAGASYGGYMFGEETIEETYGSQAEFTDPEGQDYRFHAQELDALFRESGVRFDAKSIAFKGIGTKHIYEYLRLAEAEVGDKIELHGYVSTTVRRANAESFAKASLLLILTRLDRIDALIPPNEAVKNAAMGPYPEQEILLDRGHAFTVTHIASCRSIAGARQLCVLTLETHERLVR